ncbi:hypothetical protein GC169_04535 [bacterium]|nr:hypothetical protein [bacterium]
MMDLRAWMISGVAALATTVLAACASPVPASEPAGEPAPAALSGEVRGMAFVGIVVSDLDKASAFYLSNTRLEDVGPSIFRGVLDAPSGSRNVVTAVRTLRGTNTHLRLMQFQNPSPAATAAGPVPVQGIGITHVCHQSPDDKPIFPKFVAAGAKPISRTGDLVQLRPDVPVKYAYLRDADETMLEIEQIMLPNLPYDYRMRHVAIAVADIDRTVAFYTAVLGYPPRERRSNLQSPTLDATADLDAVKLDVAWFPVSDFELEIWEYLNPLPVPRAEPRPVDAPGYNMMVFDVDNADAALERLRAAGGSPVGGRTRMDGDVIRFGRDPDGNLLGFLEASPDSPVSTTKLAVQKPRT